jgi:hypothetical protein
VLRRNGLACFGALFAFLNAGFNQAEGSRERRARARRHEAKARYYSDTPPDTMAASGDENVTEPL